MDHTYDITYQYSPDFMGWHTHHDLDSETADILLRMLHGMGRNCRVRQIATGRVAEALCITSEPLTLLHLFFKSISGKNGRDTDE